MRLFRTDDVLVDVTPDGHLLMLRNIPEPSSTHFNAVFNWFEELAARVPMARR